VSISVALANADLVIVGSGFFGLTIAERASAICSSKVVILESRPHIGGNAYSFFDQKTGIEVHKYGSHLFHTSNSKVWEYVNRFTKFTNYQHRVLTKYDGQVYSMPVNLATLCQFYGRDLNPTEARSLINEQINKMNITNPKNFEEKALSLIGQDLYDAFIKGYTTKQWQTDLKQLPPEVITRLPVRYSFNNRYFSDKWEGLPIEGYSRWQENMIDTPNISVHLNTDWFDVKHFVNKNTAIVYTGPIDRYFNYSFGSLNWRTLDFKTEILDIGDFQGTSVMNYADMSVPFTRIHEYRHLHPERQYPDSQTIISYEYSRAANLQDEPYYPTNLAEDRVKLEKYRKEAKKSPNVIFGGRLGTYQYLDMHMAIASALSVFENELLPILRNEKR
jgi:UDP-galactopyranose mutase